MNPTKLLIPSVFAAFAAAGSALPANAAVGVPKAEGQASAGVSKAFFFGYSDRRHHHGYYAYGPHGYYDYAPRRRYYRSHRDYYGYSAGPVSRYYHRDGRRYRRDRSMY